MSKIEMPATISKLCIQSIFLISFLFFSNAAKSETVKLDGFAPGEIEARNLELATSEKFLSCVAREGVRDREISSKCKKELDEYNEAKAVRLKIGKSIEKKPEFSVELAKKLRMLTVEELTEIEKRDCSFKEIHGSTSSDCNTIRAVLPRKREEIFQKYTESQLKSYLATNCKGAEKSSSNCQAANAVSMKHSTSDVMKKLESVKVIGLAPGEAEIQNEENRTRRILMDCGKKENIPDKDLQTSDKCKQEYQTPHESL